MNINFAFQGLEELGKNHFSRCWPMSSIRELEPELEQISEQAMVKMVKRVKIDLSPSSFPALKRIMELLKEEQAKINLMTALPEPLSRRENDKQFASRFGEKVSEHEKLSMALCIRIAEGFYTMEQRIQACEHMESRFPGVGWKGEAVHLIQQQRGEHETISNLRA